jgi:hypothetical protein
MGQDLHPPRHAATASAGSTADDATLQAIPGLWLGRDLARVPRPGIATGFASLDAELPGGGWPAGALTEVLHHHAGIGELRLFFPALCALARGGAPVFLLAPPWLPYAPAFSSGGIDPSRLIVVRPRHPADALWACEHILKGLSGGALIAWPRQLRMQDARRLQLAVEGKPVLAVLMRPGSAAADTSTAALRVALEAGRPDPQDGTVPLSLRILKRRGGVLARPIVLVPPSPLFARPVTPLPELPLPHAVDRDPSAEPDARVHPASA